MGLEGGVSKLSDLNASWPLATDDKNQGDDHLRNIKAALASLIPDGLVVPYGLVQLGFPAVWAAGNLFQVDSDGISLKAVAPSALTGIDADTVDTKHAADFATAGHTHSHTALTDKGTNTHAQIDTHIANTSNPHSVTGNQVLPSQTGNSGKYLKTDGANSSWAALEASGGLRGITVFTGSGTWTKSAGVSKIKVIVIGGGGGGQGGSASSYNAGAGGGAGGCSIKFIDVSAISSVTVTVGAAGGNGTAGNYGQSGGTSSFGTHCSAAGGAGGGSALDTTGGGAGGSASNGTINISGGSGGGGGVSGTSQVYHPGGLGGSSYLGGGGRGSTGVGAAGQAYGSGGSGGGWNQAGGIGVAGVVIVEEYS